MKNKLSSPFTKKLLATVFPIAFQQFMSVMVSASDAMMLGVLAQDALSAVSLASQVIFVENLFLAAMTIGLFMFAAQYWGKVVINIVTKDILANVVAVGNPCRVLREVNEHDKEYYFMNRKIDYHSLVENPIGRE